MTAIAQQNFIPVVRDPGSATEVFVNGPINMNIMGNVATLTFTTVRMDLPASPTEQPKNASAVVTSRLTMPVETLWALREMLSKNIQAQPVHMGSSRPQ